MTATAEINALVPKTKTGLEPIICRGLSRGSFDFKTRRKAKRQFRGRWLNYCDHIVWQIREGASEGAENERATQPNPNRILLPE